jgi:hypothetical protein
MNPRERVLAMVVLSVVVLAGGLLLFHQMFLVPLDERDGTIGALEQEVQQKRDRMRQLQAEMPKLQRCRQLSLPANVDSANRQYANYLNELMRDSKFADGTFTISPPKQIESKSAPSIPGKGPIYLKLAYIVQARTSLAHLVTMLDRFYRTSLLHKVKSISIQRAMTGGTQQQSSDLEINLVIEALIVSGVENRPYLLPGIDRRLLLVDVVTALRSGPAGLALVPWVLGPTGPSGPGILARTTEQYAAIGDKNIFLGRQPPERQADEVEVTQFVHLTDITRNQRHTEAFFYDRYNNRRIRLRPQRGFDSFKVLDDKGDTLVRGLVIEISPRDMIFKVGDNYYSIHVGQSLKEAMKSPLTAEQRKLVGSSNVEKTIAR